ncbi:hypothetical protein KR038_011146 [Drosophila bunnanda]|nr:hypothetical protein KR038_011146 [Drosophila bunnanda]
MEGLVPQKSIVCARPVEPPKITQIKTIVVGIKFVNGVMIATDIRPTIGTNISNIHRLHENIYAGVTGVGQDTCAFVSVIKSKLELHYMTTNYRRVPVRCANQMIKQMLHSQIGKLNVNLLIAGVDKYGTSIYTTRFDGSSDTVPFTAIGTGTMRALTVLETRWSMGLDEATARDVILEAVVCGTGQGSKIPVRLCILYNDYSMTHVTLGSIEQPPKLQTPTILRFAPKILHERVERVERVESRTLRSPEKCVAKERGEKSAVEKEKGEEGGQEKIDEKE